MKTINAKTLETVKREREREHLFIQHGFVYIDYTIHLINKLENKIKHKNKIAIT